MNVWGSLPLIDVLKCVLIRNSVCFFQEEDDPWSPVGPLLCQVDPRRQAVPVEDYLIGSQQSTCHQEIQAIKEYLATDPIILSEKTFSWLM